MDENNTGTGKADAQRRWRQKNKEHIKRYRTDYNRSHRAAIRLRAKNLRRLKKIESESASGRIQLTPAQVDILEKLYPGIGPKEAIRLLIAAEIIRRVR